MTDSETDTAIAAELRGATTAVARHLREINVILDRLSTDDRAAAVAQLRPGVARLRDCYSRFLRDLRRLA